MTWLIGILISLVVITLVILYFFPNLFAKSVQTSATGPYELSKVNTLFTSELCQQFQSSFAASLQGFFYIVPLQRTPTALPCNTPGNPSCEDGRFKKCQCKTEFCSDCVRNGYLPILKLADILSLEILGAPDAGRQGKAMAQLVIKTQSNVDASGNYVDASGNNVSTSVKYIETIALPPLPLQKWVMISIVREGRRYDIYYNNELVLSKKTDFEIADIVTKDNVKLGNPGFYGTSGLMNISMKSMSGMDVARVYSSYTDTRGVPLLSIPSTDISKSTSPTTFSYSMPSINISPPTLPSLPSLGLSFSVCPSGSCVSTPTFRPAKPWLDWDTTYA